MSDIKYTFETQKVDLESIYNARELGGYVLPDGRKIKKGMLLRGGALAKASREDLATLSSKYHLAHIFDFRTRTEVFLAPDRPVFGSDQIWLPAIDETSESMADNTLPEEAYADLVGWLARNATNSMLQRAAKEIYTSMITNEYTQLQYTSFLQTIVRTESGGIYWHCSQGKDRTGLGAAFILAALGADRELILKDFLISNEYYAEVLASSLELVKTEPEKDVIRTFIGVNGNYFNDALDLIDRRYGSLTAYIQDQLLLSEQDMEILRQRYLE